MSSAYKSSASHQENFVPAVRPWKTRPPFNRHAHATPFEWKDPSTIPRRTDAERARYEAEWAEEDPPNWRAYTHAFLEAHAKIHGVPQAPSAAPPRAIRATRLALRDPSTIPPREWIYGRHYIRRFISCTFGAGGGGKSAHAITEALAMATGRWILGDPPQKPVRVWYFNGEDPLDEIERRFAAAAAHFRISEEDIGDRILADSGRDQPLVVAQTSRGSTILAPIVEDIIAEAIEREIDVLIVDPFVSTHSVPENDNGAIQAVAEQWAKVADHAGIAVELIHHVRKGEGDKTADDGRGAGSLVAKARSVRVINAMTAEQATLAGIPPAERPDYFRLEFSKTNLARRGTLPAWRRFVGVRLGNGGKGNLASLKGDEIGVVTEWQWPSAEALTSDVTSEQFEAIRGRIGGGDCRADPRSGNWAGLVVAEVLGVEADLPGEKKRIGKMLDAWIDEGHFEVEERHDVATRRVKKFIVPAAASVVDSD